MIEDKDLELKIADSPEEKLWIQIKEQAEKTILQSKAEIEVQEVVLVLANSKIEKFK